MNSITKLAHRLMLVAASILVLAGIPSIDVGENVFADREAAGYHGPVGDINQSTACWSNAPSTDLLVTHHINHCNKWALIGLIVALAGVILLAAGTGSLAAAIVTAIGFSAAIAGIVLAIIAGVCGIAWTDYRLDCADGKFPQPTQPSGPH